MGGWVRRSTEIPLKTCKNTETGNKYWVLNIWICRWRVRYPWRGREFICSALNGLCEPGAVSAPTQHMGKVTWAGSVVVSLSGKMKIGQKKTLLLQLLVKNWNGDNKHIMYSSEQKDVCVSLHYERYIFSLSHLKFNCTVTSTYVSFLFRSLCSTRYIQYILSNFMYSVCQLPLEGAKTNKIRSWHIPGHVISLKNALYHLPGSPPREQRLKFQTLSPCMWI